MKAVHTGASPVEFADRMQFDKPEAVQLVEGTGLHQRSRRRQQVCPAPNPSSSSRSCHALSLNRTYTDALQAQPVSSIGRGPGERSGQRGGSNSLTRAHKPNSTIYGRVVAHHERPNRHISHAGNAQQPRSPTSRPIAACCGSGAQPPYGRALRRVPRTDCNLRVRARSPTGCSKLPRGPRRLCTARPVACRLKCDTDRPLSDQGTPTFEDAAPA